jgi:Mlc titration factor MtfA (ptsG expression regulator)
MEIIIIIAVVIGIIGFFRSNLHKGVGQAFDFKPEYRIILAEKVAFYNGLSEEEKTRFETELSDFLKRTRVTGIDTSIDDTDKLLVAASAVIPVFGFRDWHYGSITEVLIYPNSFNANFETAGHEEGSERRITGMVGTGAMNGTMILSKQALHVGFMNDTDKQNTAIHEFVHLIDKTDGAIDGIPENLLGKQYVLPWINLMSKEIKQINANKSDINPYGATNQSEFFAVVSEYFFEQPQLLQKKHPELYAMLERIFVQQMNLKTLTAKKFKIGRNDPCPCGKGQKFKNCCGAVHFAK